jgi:four helix bundle protein
MEDHVKKFPSHQLGSELWKEFWVDSEVILRDIRGREIVRQLTKSVGSITANIEEGYGRGFSRDYLNFLKYARGSARESKGWYEKSAFLLKEETLTQRIQKLDSIIGLLSKAIMSLEKTFPKK